MQDSVVITGVGLVSALGNDLDTTWNHLVDGRSGIGRIDAFDVEGFDCRYGALVHGLTPEGLGVHGKGAGIMDRHACMLLKSTRDTHRHALPDPSLPPERIAYFAAMGMVDYHVEDLLGAVIHATDEDGTLNYEQFFSGAYEDIHPLWPLSMLNNIHFCQVAIDLGIKGESIVFCPHSPASVEAVVEACHTVLGHKADLALAGGVSENVSPMSLTRASLAGVLNGAGDQCHPFAAHATGTILGEGAGMLAIERLSSARKRGVSALARIKGYGASFGRDEEAPSPTAKAMAVSIHDALRRSGLDPGEIDLIIAHGDGTAGGDRNELEAIAGVFEHCFDELPVYTSKSALGHSLSGAGAMDMVLATCMLKHSIIPPIGRRYEADKTMEQHLVRDKPVRRNIRNILINAHSYEGQCASIVLGKVA